MIFESEAQRGHDDIVLSYPDESWVYNQASTSETSATFKVMCEIILWKYLMIKVTSATSEQEVSGQPVQHQRGRCSAAPLNPSQTFTHATHHTGCSGLRNCLGFLFLFCSQAASAASPQMSVPSVRRRNENAAVWSEIN